MKILIRSCIVVKDTDRKDMNLVVKNIKLMGTNDLRFDNPEDKDLWKFIKGFASKYNEAPSADTVKNHFVDNHEVSGRLDGLLCLPPVVGGNFTTRLMDIVDKQKLEDLGNLAKEVATAIQSKDAIKAKRIMGTYLNRDEAKAKKRGDPKVYRTLNDRYAYIEQRCMVFDRLTGEFVPNKSFAMRGADERAWIGPTRDGDRKTYLNVDFNPTDNPMPAHMLNMYDPTVVCKPSDTPPPLSDNMGKFQSLLSCLAPDDRDLRYLEAWLKFVITHPADKCCALILRGTTGSGKGTLCVVMEALFGRYAVRLDNERLESRFNGFMRTCLLAIGDEVGSDFFKDKRAAANKFKGLITEGKLQIEAKGQDSVEVANYTKWLFTANQAVPLVLEANDRRYSVLDTPDKLDPALGHWIGNAVYDPEFLQAVVDYLTHYAPGMAFKPWTPHMSEAREAVIEGSLGSSARWWRHELPPTGRYPTNALYTAYLHWLEGQGEKAHSQQVFVTSRPDCTKLTKQRKGTVKPSLRAFIKGDTGWVIDVTNQQASGTYEEWATIEVSGDYHSCSGVPSIN